MITALRRMSGEDGFTLIEAVAALAVFTILTVGMIPLLASSLKGVDLSRTLTRGKNLAQEYMERVRGLPFFDAAPRRDVLDLYFPNLLTGYSGGTFTTTCTPTTQNPPTSGALACPPNNPDGTSRIPAGHTVTYTAQFVRPVLNSNPETYSVVTPYAGYDSASPASAIPPANLLRITVSVGWNQAGKPRTFQLVSLLGDRKLGNDQVHAESSVDFTVQALTSYEDLTGRLSSLTAVTGQAKSDIELKAFAGADFDVSAARINLSRQEFGASPGATIATVSGAESNQHAPPNVTPTLGTGTAQTVTNPDVAGLPVAGIAATNVNESVPAPTVEVVNELPKSVTNFNFPSSNEIFWVNNQADVGRNTLLHLHATEHPFSIWRDGSNRLSGNTYAEATAVTPLATRKVQATAHAQFGKAIVLPTTFASGDKGVVVISNFVADVDCKSTGSLAGAVANGTWSATFTYWRDTNPADGFANGSYVTVPDVSGSVTGAGPDPLAAIKTENPLVYDTHSNNGDIYLFDDPAAGKVGYLDTWSSTKTMTSAKTSQNSSVSMPYAINIVTAKTNQENPESKLVINIGKLSCQTADRRA